MAKGDPVSWSVETLREEVRSLSKESQVNSRAIDNLYNILERFIVLTMKLEDRILALEGRPK